MNDKTLALLNEVTNSLADDIEDFSCGELRQALYRAIAQREEAAERIEALEAALLPFVSKCDYIEELELSDDDYVECCPFQAVHYRRAKQALKGSGNG